MKPIFIKYGFSFFLLLAVVQLCGIVFNVEWLRFYSKPLLMPSLAVAVYTSTYAGKERNIILTALFFSFLGDSFLLFDNKNSLYFIFGLASFLITHILYIVYFISIKTTHTSFLKKNTWIIILILAYGAGLVWLLFPLLASLKLPVIIYAITICSMLLASIHVFKSVNKNAGFLYIGGAMLFVVSDSLLAINKFYASFSAASFLIMFTYIAAQYFIAKGFVKTRQLN